MDENIRERLIAAHIDVDEAMERFAGNYGLLERFLRRFPDDENYSLLQKYLEEGNTEDAFRACHTLKGLCANLSMNDMVETVSRQVEYLRAGNIQEAKAVMPHVSEKYDRMIAAVKDIYSL